MLLLNFKRSVICKLADIPTNELYSWCRLATLDEIDLYNKFGVEKLKFTEIQNSDYPTRQSFKLKKGESRAERMNKKNNATIEVIINRHALLKLHKLLETNNLTTHSEAISYLLSIGDNKENHLETEIAAANKKIELLENKINNIKKTINR